MKTEVKLKTRLTTQTPCSATRDLPGGPHIHTNTPRPHNKNGLFFQAYRLSLVFVKLLMDHPYTVSKKEMRQRIFIISFTSWSESTIDAASSSQRAEYLICRCDLRPKIIKAALMIQCLPAKWDYI